MEKSKDSRFVIIVKIEKYIEYMLTILLKLPRTEKFSIGTEYKLSLYKMLEEIMYLNKMDKSSSASIIVVLNKIDSLLMAQRIYLRIMKNNRWIDEKKFNIAIELLLEIGKILGGLIKYYAKNTKK